MVVEKGGEEGVRLFVRRRRKEGGERRGSRSGGGRRNVRRRKEGGAVVKEGHGCEGRPHHRRPSPRHDNVIVHLKEGERERKREEEEEERGRQGARPADEEEEDEEDVEDDEVRSEHRTSGGRGRFGEGKFQKSTRNKPKLFCLKRKVRRRETRRKKQGCLFIQITFRTSNSTSSSLPLLSGLCELKLDSSDSEKGRGREGESEGVETLKGLKRAAVHLKGTIDSVLDYAKSLHSLVCPSLSFHSLLLPNETYFTHFSASLFSLIFCLTQESTALPMHPFPRDAIFYSFRECMQNLQRMCGNRLSLVLEPSDLENSDTPSSSFLSFSLFSSPSSPPSPLSLSLPLPDDVIWGLLVMSVVFFVDFSLAKGNRVLTLSLSLSSSPLSPPLSLRRFLTLLPPFRSQLTLRICTRRTSAASDSSSLLSRLPFSEMEREKGEGDLSGDLISQLRYAAVVMTAEAAGGRVTWRGGRNDAPPPSLLAPSECDSQWEDFRVKIPVFGILRKGESERGKRMEGRRECDMSRDKDVQRFLSERYLSRLRGICYLNERDDDVITGAFQHSPSPSPGSQSPFPFFLLP